MRIIILLALFFAGCKSQKNDALSGTWEYSRMEFYEGRAIDQNDSLVMRLHQMQKGLILNFSNNKDLKVTQRKDNGKEDALGNQPYELASGQKELILKNKGRADDRFPIISISDSILKLNMFNSKEGYLVFKKK